MSSLVVKCAHGHRAEAAEEIIANLERWKREATVCLGDWHTLTGRIPDDFTYGRLGQPWPTVIAAYIDHLEARPAPADWDTESFCAADGCHQPATHTTLAGMVDTTPLYELVCCTHAARKEPE